ncbi:MULTISPECIES: hypothetical protein [unclassified Rickettsia]
MTSKIRAMQQRRLELEMTSFLRQFPSHTTTPPRNEDVFVKPPQRT